MTRLRDRKEKAYLIPTEVPSELRAATLSVRPLRLAFLVDAQAQKEELLKYIVYNSSIWGGSANYFVSIYDSTISDNWWHVLERNDPDKVIFCADFKEQLREEVFNRIQPFFMLRWSDNVAENHKYGFDGLGSVPLHYVLQHIYKRERPIQQSNIRIPECVNDTILCFCAASQFGHLDKDLHDFYTQIFKAELVQFGDGSLEEYLESVAQLESRLVPSAMTTWRLSSHIDSMEGSFGASIVILGSSATAEDFCIFWNLRASESLMFSKKSLLLPGSVFDSGDDLRVLGKWCVNHIKGTNSLSLISASLGAQELVEIRDRFKPFVSDRFLIDLWYANFAFSRLRRYDLESKEEIRVTDRTFNLRPPKPSWSDQAQSGMEWVVDLDLRSRLIASNGYIPPKYPKLNHLLAREPEPEYVRLGRGYKIRSTHERLSLRLGRNDEFVQITLPEDERLFQSLLHSGGFRAEATEKSRYARGIIGLLGKYQEVRIFQETGVRDLFDAMKDGSALTPSEMKGHLKPGKKASRQQEVERVIAELAFKGIFLRGYQLRCPACDLQRWYSLEEIAETMQCAGCLTKIQPPVEAPFHYRLNELFVRGIEQGSMSLLLTILLLSRLGQDSYLFLPGIMVRRDSQAVDIDILAACDGYLVVVESKDLQEGYTSEIVTETIEQLRSVTKVTQEIGAPILIFSTLLDALPQELRQGIEELRQQYPNVAIHFALRADLERGYLIPEGRDKPASLTDLFPQPETQQTGWIQEPGRKFSTF
jgi:hypothetical protein